MLSEPKIEVLSFKIRNFSLKTCKGTDQANLGFDMWEMIFTSIETKKKWRTDWKENLIVICDPSFRC